MSAETERAAEILRDHAGDYMTTTVRMAITGITLEAVAEWLENHAGDPRAAEVARQICAEQDYLLTAYLAREGPGEGTS